MSPARKTPALTIPRAPVLATTHVLRRGDARDLAWLPDQSLHLALTSPPYWTLKKYHDHPGQLGAWADYETFLDELDKVWTEIYRALVPGGRLVIVVGDVCLSRRKNNGVHEIVPIHADLAVHARRIGFNYLTPIYWYKISNVATEVQHGSAFLGRPFEPNAIVKNEIEYILFFRKPGGYRSTTAEQRAASRLSKDEYNQWFRPIWTDVHGASTRDHPAPYPVELAHRLVRMFSFVGDTVLDPFLGTGTTTIAALQAGRNSLGVEIDPTYLAHAATRIRAAIAQTPTVDGPSRLDVIETVGTG